MQLAPRLAKIRQRTLTFAIAVPLVGACSPTQSTPQAESDASASTAPAYTFDTRLPLDAFTFTEVELQTVRYAYSITIASCLSSVNGSFQAIDRRSSSLQSRRFGISDANLAAQHGYGLGPMEAPSQQERENRNILSRPEVKSRIGDCEADVSSPMRLLGETMPTPLAQNLSLESYTALLDTAAAEKAIGEFHECMSAAGYVMSRDDPWVPTGADLKPVEWQIIAATHDLACKRETELIVALVGIETGLQNSLIDQHRSQLSTEVDEWKSVVDAAQDVIDGF